ncbi:MAG: ABC transporter ATP-binding protein [Eubacteriales bacterium]|nr:ABC transporter ATP-binding protein [Eubacteriales bacterium]
MKPQHNYHYLIKRFLPYYKPHLKILVLDLLCAAFTAVSVLILPPIISKIVTIVQTDITQLTPKFILAIGALYLVIRIIDSIAYYYMATTGHIMGVKMEAHMRTDLFSHLQTLPISYYNDTKVGQLMSRITNDLFDVTEFAHHCPEEFFIAALKFVISFIVLARINIPLTLILFAMVPLMYYASSYFRKRMRNAFRERRKQIGEINAQIEDSLLGIRVVQSFANEHKEILTFNDFNRRFVNIKTESYHYMGGFHTVTRLFDGLMYITVIVIGAFFLLNKKISAGDYVSYILYISALITVVRTLIQYTEAFQNGMTGIERFVEIMDEKSDIVDVPNAKHLESAKGKIEFQNVAFQYGTDKPNVFSNISEIVEPGTSVALVGPSGGGKTTLVNLIPRFYNVSEGKILLDDTDIQDIALSSLRNNIGMVQQEVYLFSSTIIANIEYGKPGASFEEIVEAAKLAGAHDFIMELPEQYNTYIGERGLKLSGGQKQRLSIARVFLKNPPILILDEATSALDNESERVVQESLTRLSKGRTVFTIAHRLTTIKNADCIWVLDENKIVEKGSHKDLLAKNGLYAQFYAMYQENQHA